MTKALEGYVKIKFQAEKPDEEPARSVMSGQGDRTANLRHPPPHPRSGLQPSSPIGSVAVYAPVTRRIRERNSCVVQVTPVQGLTPAMTHSSMRPRRFSRLSPALIAALAILGFAPPVEAQNEALLRLLQVLRDRGSITAQEYDDIRKVAESPQSPATTTVPVGALEQRVAAQEKAVAAIKAQTDGNSSSNRRSSPGGEMVRADSVCVDTRSSASATCCPRKVRHSGAQPTDRQR